MSFPGTCVPEYCAFTLCTNKPCFSLMEISLPYGSPALNKHIWQLFFMSFGFGPETAEEKQDMSGSGGVLVSQNPHSDLEPHSQQVPHFIKWKDHFWLQIWHWLWFNSILHCQSLSTQQGAALYSTLKDKLTTRGALKFKTWPVWFLQQQTAVFFFMGTNG